MSQAHCLAMPYRFNFSPHTGLPAQIRTASGRYATHPAAPPRQLGAAMVEFGIVAISLLLLSLLIIEAAHWQIVRQLAYVALLDSARAGATQHARRDVIEQAFTQSFLPRFVYAGSHARTAQQRTWNRIQQLTDLPAWRIEVLPPDRTPTLHARLTYLHEPLTLLIRPLLRRVAPLIGDCAARAALAHGFMAIRLDLRIEMHSDPMQWATTPPARHDRVVYGAWNCGG